MKFVQCKINMIYKGTKIVKNYIRDAKELLDIKLNGKPIKLDELPDEKKEYYQMLIIETAKMIQLEVLKGGE